MSEEELQQLKDGGQLSGDELVWNETLTDWVPLSSLSQFGDSPPAMGAPTPEAAPAANPSASASEPSPTLSPVTNTAQTLPPGEKIPTYLWQSIVCLILCCLPLAIPGIVFATKVDPAIARGDIAAAKEASAKAKMWCWISFGVGIVANILIFGASFLSAFMEVQ